MPFLLVYSSAFSQGCCILYIKHFYVSLTWLFWFTRWSIYFCCCRCTVILEAYFSVKR